MIIVCAVQGEEKIAQRERELNEWAPRLVRGLSSSSVEAIISSHEPALLTDPLEVLTLGSSA